jgi:penicillin V acylase-like amidase (Ntn superfamily)
MKSKQSALIVAIALALMLVSCLQSPDIPLASPNNPPVDSPSTDHGCTSFCLRNDGPCIFGTNHDNSVHEGILYVNKRGLSKTGWDRSTTGEVARWTSKYGSLTFNLVGYQLPWAGINEAGLMISTMALEANQPPAPDERPPLETSLWVQYQLDTSSTVEEVLASDSLVRMTSQLPPCCHYLVCDQIGACATIEFLEGETVVHSGNTLPVEALTNNTYEESLQAWRDRSLEELAGVDEVGLSLFRFAIAAQAVTNFKPVDSETAIDYAFDTLALANTNWTVWSIVFDPDNLRVFFHTNLNSKQRHIDFSQLDFTCGTPVQMLDVHADLSGDISGDLETYAHNPSLDHFVNVMAKLGLESNRGQLNSLLQQKERFTCSNGEAHIQKDAPPAIAWILPIAAAVLVIASIAVLFRARGRSSRDAQT